MRCDQCNKFVSFEENEPEVDSLDVSDDGTVSASVRIVNSCIDCGQELKEATFEFETDHSAECAEHQGDGHELSVEENSVDRTARSGFFKKGIFVPAGGRYAKMFYGAELSYSVTCSCGNLSIDDSFNDDVQASGMDELV